MTTDELLKTNQDRHRAIEAPFNPITGEGAFGIRVPLEISGFPIAAQYVPKEMMSDPLIKKICRAKSIDKFISQYLKEEPTEEVRLMVIENIVRIRFKHDFPFWAGMYAYIKRKGGGSDMLFWLNRPQRKLIERLEEMRRAGKPIRLILLKARQWGGSTAVQIYMAWLQLIHEEGLNSLIVGHVKAAATEVKSMFERLIEAYPTSLLYPIGASFNDKEPKIVGVGTEMNIKRIPQRNCNIKIGSAESPDSARGGDYNLVHCTEVGLWKKTEGKSPEEIIRSACSGVLLKPMTMIVYESTANGTGNFFHREWEAAKKGISQFAPLFVAWYEIEQYSLDFSSEDERRAFADNLIRYKDRDISENERCESGRYLWWLWERGATLEAIHWYITERAKYNDHGDMASEYPSDDIEAFVHSGAKIFDRYQVEELRKTCKAPIYTGEVVGKSTSGEEALQGLHFDKTDSGRLDIWALPEEDTDDEIVSNRYLVVVDIGGRSQKADYSVIVVFDRLFMMDGGNPSVCAQWYGHIDMDVLAWKSAQIASFYNNALLVIESNTLETHDRERQVDGDLSHYILNQIKDVYDNLYARKQSEQEVIDRMPKKYGFHTNTSTKPMVIASLQRAIRERLYTERDERCIDEYLCYERKPNGSVGAIAGKHDDLLMTRAIGLHICFQEMDIPSIIKRNRQANKRKAKTAQEALLSSW